MKYLEPKEIAKRHSKTNLTFGAFGTVGNKQLKNKKVKSIPLATPKGKIASTYIKYRVGKNKVSKDYSKGK
jgi:hypothetical protein